MGTKFAIFVFLCFSAWTSIVHAQEGQFCRTPNNERGTCVNILNCPPLLNLLKTQSNNNQVRAFLLRSACGYVGPTPIVCCPGQGRTLPTRQTIPTAPPSPPPTRPTPFIPPQTTKAPINNNGGNKASLLRPNACGYTNITNGRIVGGTPALLGEFPWIVALGYRNSKNPDAPKWLCGATLITTRHLLTAGHCVHNRDDLYIARLGELDLYSDTDGANPVTIPIMQRKVHEDYNPTSFTNDIAVLTLAQSPDVPGVWPICLPLDDPLKSNLFVGYNPFVAGWGSIYFNGPSSAVLQKVQLPVVSLESCKNAYANLKSALIDERVMCAGNVQGGKDSCRGDSGGPLMFPVSKGDYNLFYQIGVVSYGVKCAEPGYYGVYSRVTAFLDWIGRNLD